MKFSKSGGRCCCQRHCLRSDLRNVVQALVRFQVRNQRASHLQRMQKGRRGPCPSPAVATAARLPRAGAAQLPDMELNLQVWRKVLRVGCPQLRALQTGHLHAGLGKHSIPHTNPCRFSMPTSASGASGRHGGHCARADEVLPDRTKEPPSSVRVVTVPAARGCWRRVWMAQLDRCVGCLA